MRHAHWMAACGLLVVVAGVGPARVPTASGPPPPPRPGQAGSNSARAGIHLTAGRTTSFVWVKTDTYGYRWDVSSNGSVSEGTNDAYDGAMQLSVNGTSLPGFSTGRLSPDGMEVEIGPWQRGDVSVSRRIFVNTKAGYCRWIDIFENQTSSVVPLSLKYYSNMGASTNRTYTSSGQAQLSEHDWGIVTAGSSTRSLRPAVAHIFASPRAKVSPSFQFSTGSDNLYYHVGLDVPARKAVALCYFEVQRRPFEAAVEFLKAFDHGRELKLVPAPLRRILVNMTGASMLLGSVELRRSDEFDLILLRNGDEIRGRITTDGYALRTEFGKFELPASDVLGLVSRSSEKNLVKVALVNGEVVAGELLGGPLEVRLPGGTALKIPPTGMTQAAYGVSDEKPEEIRATGSMIVLRRGERLAFDDADVSFRFRTLHGTVALSAADLRSIEMDTPAGGLHQAVFRNGSTLAGLLEAEQLPLRLELGPSISVPGWQVRRILLATERSESKDLAEMSLRNQDLLRGRCTDETWTVESGFGEVAVDPRDVREAKFTGGALGHVQVTLRNGTKIGGRLSADHVGFAIVPGPALKVFVGRIESFRAGATASATSRPAEEDRPGETGSGPSGGEATGGTELSDLDKKLKEATALQDQLAKDLQIAKAGMGNDPETARRVMLLARRLADVSAEAQQLRALRASLSEAPR